jgi:maleylpyruvate isomerase
VTTDPLALLEDVRRATDRLLHTADTLTDDEVAGPSLLPGWTRGHVLAHVARNAEATVNLLTWARTGVRTPAYRSPQARADAIEAGSGRRVAEQRRDVRDTAEQFAIAADAMPVEAWLATLDLPTGPEPAARIAWRRLREVEVHHVDLDAGYRPADWPPGFAHRLLHEVVAGLAARSDAPALRLRPDGLEEMHVGDRDRATTVSGPPWSLAAWLIGRLPGTALTVEPEGPLPSVPEWI